MDFQGSSGSFFLGLLFLVRTHKNVLKPFDLHSPRPADSITALHTVLLVSGPLSSLSCSLFLFLFLFFSKGAQMDAVVSPHQGET